MASTARGSARTTNASDREATAKKRAQRENEPARPEVIMSRLVHCVVLKREAEGLDEPPHPGPLGERIYSNVSNEGWQQWLERLQMIMNENQLNTADERSMDLIEQHMIGFLFDEGEYGGLPTGFRTAGGKK